LQVVQVHVRFSARAWGRKEHVAAGGGVPGRTDADAARKADVVREEAGQYSGVGAAEHGHVRAAARARAGDEVGVAVAVHVAGRHVAAAGKVRVVGEELADQVSGLAVVDVDVRPAARGRGGDNVRHAVAGDVADRHADAAAEIRVVGVEGELFG